MSAASLTQNWALLLAAGVLLPVVVLLLHRLWSRSARGQLNAWRREFRRRLADQKRAKAALDKRRRRLDKLRGRAASVKPRRITELEEAVVDAEALLKIAEDQVLIAENHVRKVILEEYPPKRHEDMRRKYLSPRGNDARPFSF